MSNDLELAIQTAKQAGQIIRSNYKKNKQIKKKGVNDFTTDTDVQVEQFIIKQLTRTGYSFFGEETGEKLTLSKKKWVIDPLDGTSNFIRGNPFFAVSIALIEDDRELLLGVVYDPMTDECYWAEKNAGAYMNEVKIKTSEEKDIGSSVFLMDHGSLKKDKENFLQCLKQITLDKGPAVLRQGATALMLCYVAKGSFEAFLSCGDKLYDYAAGLIIAQESGANVSDWNGKIWDNSSSYILVSNTPLNKPIIKRISKIQGI